MTLNWAKSIIVPILRRWETRTIWSVRWPNGDTTECRWFKTMHMAQEFACLLAGAVIVRHTLRPEGRAPVFVEDIPPAQVANDQDRR